MEHKNDTEFNAKLWGKQKFGFRKLTIGLAAVALGTTFFMSNGHLVKADENNSNKGNDDQTEKDQSDSQDQNSQDEDAEQKFVDNKTNELKVSDLSKKSENNTDSENKTPAGNNEATNSKLADNKTANKDQADANSAVKNAITTNKVDSSKDSSNTTSFNVKQNTNKANASDLAKELSEEKNKTPSSTYSSSASVDETDPTTKTNMDKTEPLIAGQDAIKVNVHVDLTNQKITSSDPLTIQVLDGNDDNFNNMKVDTNFGNDTRGWNISYNNNGSYTFVWNGKTDAQPKSIDVGFHILGDDTKITKDSGDVTIAPRIKVTYPDKTSNTTGSVFTKKYKSFNETVSQYELIKGFRQGDTTVGAEAGWDNIKKDDLAKVRKYADPDATVDSNGNVVVKRTDPGYDHKIFQWGIYFNYSKVLNKDWKDLINAYFQAKFGGRQALLPTSIKVFEVPDDLIGTLDNRIKIGDQLPVTTSTHDYTSFITKWENYDWNKNHTAPTVYNYITAGGFEKGDFEKTLTKKAEHDNNNTITFGTKDGNAVFNADGHLGKDVDGNHAYFIQVDTIDTTQPTGPTFITDNFEGNGQSRTNVQPYYSGSASIGNNYKQQEAAIIRYYDDDTNQYFDGNGNLTGEAKTYTGSFDAFHDAESTASGDPNASINFDTDAQTTYNNIIKSFDYVKITKGIDPSSTTVILDTNDKIVPFNTKGIYSSYDDTKDDGNGDDPKPQYFIVHFKSKTPTPVAQTKSIKYEIQYVYKNGTQKSGTPFDHSTEQTVQFRSTDNGTTWSSYYTDGGNTWLNLSNGTYQISVPNTASANPKYAVYTDGITVKLNDKSFTDFEKDNNGKVTINVSSASAKDGDTYIITVPYYTTEHADVRFWDDTDNTDSAINNLLSGKLTQTTDGHYGLSDDYKNKDDNSANTAISFKNADQLVQILEDHGYQFTGMTIGSTWTKAPNSKDPYSTVKYGNFDDNETVDQHFVLHFVHGTKQGTTTESKSIDEVIDYVDEKTGKEIHSEYQATGNKEITFTRTEIVDAVTGKHIGWSDWTTGSFDHVANPTIDGYTIDYGKSTTTLNKNPDDSLATITKDFVEKIKLNDQSFINSLPAGTSHIKIVVPYIKKGQSTKPVQPTKPDQPTKPVEPTKPTSPTKPTVPTQPTKSAQPTKPQTSKPTTKKHVQKHHTRKPTPKPNYNRNNRPHFENNRHGRKTYNHNVTPHYQNGKFTHHTTTVVPHGLSTNYTPHTQKINNNNVIPHSTSYVPAKQGKVVNIQNNVKNISGKNANSSKLSKLPQTGEKQDNVSRLGILSLAASAVLALFGFAGDRKRKKN